MSTDLAQKWEIARSNCAQDPIHTLGTAQTFGGLIATDRALECITHVSDNLSEILGQNNSWTSMDMLGRPLEAVLPGELIHDLNNACSVPMVVAQRHRLGIYEIQGQTLDVCVHCSPTRTLIELEPIRPNLDTYMPLVMRAKLMLEQSSNSEQLLSLAVEELRDTTGFDRVMAYRFLADGAGEVVAEACSPGMDSYLGLRYPASDIPDVVRTLFLRIGVRIIADIHATAVPILSLDDAEAPLDMSLALIRGVSSVHTEYLENMGVRASMSIAITVNGQLWGLFALHHLRPKIVSLDLRTVIELFRQLFSLQFQQVLAEERFCDRKRTASTLDKLFAIQSDPLTHRDWKNIIIQSSQSLCQLLSAQGVAYISEQQLLDSYGETPPALAILALANHYNVCAQTDIITTECLQHLDIHDVDTWGKSAGALYFSIPADEPFYLIFFRHEIIGDIRWAGNPNSQQLVEDAAEIRLRPRRSFEEYKETLEGRCSPWTSFDLNTALEIRTELIRLARVNVQDFQQRQQNLLVAELNHRVKNILVLIRSIARQTEKSASSLEDYTKNLERRIAALSAAHDLVTGYGLEWPNLRNLLAIELRPYLNDTKPRVSLTGPVIGLKASFVPTFVLVLHELTSNAAKYGALSVVSGTVSVYWSESNGGVKLIWQESDGPPVVNLQRRGFGQDLIERAIPYEFEGEAVLHFLASGVKAEFWLPNSLIRWGQERTVTTSSTSITPDSASLAHAEQIKILIVEDSLLVAMEMENTLKKIGFEAVTSAPSVERALKYLQQDSYQFCLLDIDLKKETSFEVAYFLLKQSIPFIFTSGYNSKHPIPESLKLVQLLQKPIDGAKLEKLIRDLLN
ncbi:MAG: HWE histidine kinase domain-containing protein [Cyanobacteria bacterium P01_H01_bin.105]